MQFTTEGEVAAEVEAGGEGVKEKEKAKVVSGKEGREMWQEIWRRNKKSHKTTTIHRMPLLRTKVEGKGSG